MHCNTIFFQNRINLTYTTHHPIKKNNTINKIGIYTHIYQYKKEIYNTT